jgi:hypothetical protein
MRQSDILMFPAHTWTLIVQPDKLAIHSTPNL